MEGPSEQIKIQVDTRLAAWRAQQPPAEPELRYEVDQAWVDEFVKMHAPVRRDVLKRLDLRDLKPRQLPSSIAIRMLALAEREGCGIDEIVYSVGVSGRTCIWRDGNWDGSLIDLKTPGMTGPQRCAISEAVYVWKSAQPFTPQPEDAPEAIIDAVNKELAAQDPNAAMIERDGAPRAKPTSIVAPARAQPHRATPAGLLTLAPITRTGTSFGAWGAVSED